MRQLFSTLVGAASLTLTAARVLTSERVSPIVYVLAVFILAVRLIDARRERIRGQQDLQARYQVQMLMLSLTRERCDAHVLIEADARGEFRPAGLAPAAPSPPSGQGRRRDRQHRRSRHPHGGTVRPMQPASPSTHPQEEAE